MYINDIQLLKSVKWDSITKDEVTLTINGEELRQEVYEELKLKIDERFSNPVKVNFQDYLFLEITPNECFNEKECMQLAKEIVNTLNNQIKTQLKLND